MVSQNGSAFVAVVVGSESDIERVKQCFTLLRQTGLTFQTFIMSAHRDPDKVRSFAIEARNKGFQVIIAAAGLAAALPGAIAAYTDLPVIALPLEVGPLKGIDAFLSSVQMPPGTPVLSVGINNCKNAVLAAARILALQHLEIHDRIEMASDQHREKKAAEMLIKGKDMYPYKEQGRLMEAWYNKEYRRVMEIAAELDVPAREFLDDKIEQLDDEGFHIEGVRGEFPSASEAAQAYYDKHKIKALPEEEQ